MKYTSILSIPLLLAVSACGSMMGHYGKGTPNVLQPTAPMIDIVDSASGAPAMVLDQEPLVLTKAALATPPVTDPITGKSGVPIVWNLPANSIWEFEPENGIFFETPPNVPADIVKRYALDRFIAFDDPAGEIFSCRQVKPSQFRCLTTPAVSANYKRFKYSVHLRQTAKPEVKLVLDPNIWR